MARFYAEIRGQAKTSATRTGSTSSGISGHIRGWDSGVQVYGYNNRYVTGNDKDAFEIRLTSGSNNRYDSMSIGDVYLDDSGRPVFVPSRELVKAIKADAKELTL